MATTCSSSGCKYRVPDLLAAEGLCVLHFTLSLEQTCNDLRRQTALGQVSRERVEEIHRFLQQRGELLARVSTAGLGLSDEMKARILATFLTLINLRENLDRVTARLAASKIRP